LALQFATGALQSFNERFGVYPYTEFDVVSAPMLAGGIEYPGLIALSLDYYHDSGKDFYGLPYFESAVAHETAHQWFYNGVGSDQVDEPWLDEAMAQYSTWLYYVDIHGEAAAEDYRGSWDWKWSRVDRADTPIGLPSAVYADEEYGPIVYGRGPFYIAALAEKMGQETFDGFLHGYYDSYQWRISTGAGFKQLAERHCLCDLTDLFEEWVYER
jgi:aminopeptidase N